MLNFYHFLPLDGFKLFKLFIKYLKLRVCYKITDFTNFNGLKEEEMKIHQEIKK
jgi:hypothetical protein